MLLVKNFLFIFSLEVGGKFIGFFTLITNSLILPLSILLLVGVSVDKNLEFFREQAENMELNMFKVTTENDIKHLREYLIMFMLLSIIISSIYLVAAVLLIRGTKNRNHRQVKPAKNILAFLAIFSIFGMIMRLSPNSLVTACLYIYLFSVVYSLWKKFKTEEETGVRPIIVEAHFVAIPIEPKV